MATCPRDKEWDRRCDPMAHVRTCAPSRRPGGNRAFVSGEGRGRPGCPQTPRLPSLQGPECRSDPAPALPGSVTFPHLVSLSPSQVPASSRCPNSHPAPSNQAETSPCSSDPLPGLAEGREHPCLFLVPSPSPSPGTEDRGRYNSILPEKQLHSHFTEQFRQVKPFAYGHLSRTR